MTRSISRRWRATGIHLLASGLIAAAAAYLVFGVWYPRPFAAISGGLGLFGLIVGVDVILGPTLTAVVASPSKPIAELRRDLAVIVLLQLCAFGYGLHSITLARPVWLAFEVDRMRVVAAADIEPQLLKEAPEALRRLSWSGPKLVAAVKPTDSGEQMRSIELGLAGFDLSMIPKNWRSYESQAPLAFRAARPVRVLSEKYPQVRAPLTTIAAEARVPVEQLRFLPLVSRQVSWVAVLADPGARVVGYLPVEGFF